jgi:hypothetical protein
MRRTPHADLSYRGPDMTRGAMRRGHLACIPLHPSFDVDVRFHIRHVALLEAAEQEGRP